MGPVRHHTGMTVSPVSPVLRPLSRLTVLAGPTAVGKGTIVTELRRRHPDLFVSVSATTRAPRPGEIDGVHYHFVSDAEFDRLIAGPRTSVNRSADWPPRARRWTLRESSTMSLSTTPCRVPRVSLKNYWGSEGSQGLNCPSYR